MGPAVYLYDAKGNPIGESAQFRKESPPPLGEKFLPGWATVDRPMIQLPGGGFMAFDLDRLTLQDYRTMRNHYQVNINLRLLMFLLSQASWRVVGGDKKVRDHCEDNLREVWYRMVRALSSCFWSGYSANVLQWENDAASGKIRLSKIKDIPAEEARINWKEVPGARNPDGHAPKIRIYDGINARGHNRPIPVENTFWYPLLMENGDHYGTKLLRPSYPPYFFSQILHLYQNRYFERFGEPTPIGRYPEGKTYEYGGKTYSAKEVMNNVLEGVRNRSNIALPSEREMDPDGRSGNYTWELDFLESQLRGADFERYMSRLDEEISISLFTPALLYRTADVGSYNLGEAHLQTFLWGINSLLGDLADFITKFIIYRMVDFNFGERARKDIRFEPHHWGANTQATLRQIAAALINAERIKIDTEDLGQAIGMKVEEIRQLTEDEPEPGADNQSSSDPNSQATTETPS